MAKPPPRLRIPAEHLEAFRLLQQLAHSTAELVIDELTELPSGSPASVTKARLAELLNIEPAQAASLVRALLSVAAQGTYHGVDLGLVIAGIAGNDDLDLTPEQSTEFSTRLQRAVSTKAIWLAASAADLQVDHERVFRGARIISDIRPVFARGPVAAPEAAVISEILKLEYVRDSEVEQIFVALDRADLDALKEVVDRAILKSDFLSRMLASTGMRYVDLEEVLDEDA